MYITHVRDHGSCIEDLWRRTLQQCRNQTPSSIIIPTSLTLGADMIDGEPLMTLGRNCYRHKSDTGYLKRWRSQLAIVWKGNHGRLSADC